MTVICGDSLEVLPSLAAESVDAIVCDPPYGLSFMGKEWDHGVPGDAFWSEALRVAKPGAHLLAFGGTRTYHRLACAIEDAGWEIRDCLSWLYGSGFPKSHNLDGEKQGWGTALKPAWEPVIVARKPLVGTVASNVAQYGTGVVNVDGCRIESDGSHKVAGVVTKRTTVSGDTREGKALGMYGAGASFTPTNHDGGRWPANVVLDGYDDEIARRVDAARIRLDAAYEASANGVYDVDEFVKCREGYASAIEQQTLSRQKSAAEMLGEPARFFYTAKASRREREAGLEGMPERRGASTSNGGVEGRLMTVGAASLKGEPTEPRASRNHHPTVKPIALMRWLCRLVTPPNGLVLDPFTGSGSTGCAAVLEGFRFVGIEREPEYAEIARRRIAHWASQRETPEPDLFSEAR